MEIMRFVKYLILPITIVCSNGYSLQANNSDFVETYNLLDGMQPLVTSPNHIFFPNAILKLYPRPSDRSNCVIYVRKELENPNSEKIKVDVIKNKPFNLQNNNQLISKVYKPGLAKYNNKYYLVCYQVLESTNEYLWYYLDEDDDYFELGTTPRDLTNDNIEKYHLLDQGRVLETDGNHDDFPNVAVRCYTHPGYQVQDNIQVHKVLGDLTSELINVNLNNGNIVLDNNQQGLIQNGKECGIVRFNDDYYLAAYELIDNVYVWYYIDEDGDYNILGETPVF